MKKVLVILLLFIFSAQGTVVAVGGGLVMSVDRSGVMEMAYMEHMEHIAHAAPSIAGDADFDDLKVSSSIEEMSDYVALDPAAKQPRDHASNPPTIAPVLSSIDLPRALPPPRG
ncbi:hypothetical protein RY831_02355 [Noviherbaspirillum sp. CPCC 100848]|uniref:Uncharacterized protein n=1 Tax=Noviherbaspirillum album TaxID=3080276 RepID=A0ABU6J2Y3_9BURK|nr:hypothetical protein [Noviherbaspirillum sp. CPCC 100848]MEC4717982.1 hypothetical protein [Noviherbaspirillum sp. CPCC 100848]